MVKSALILGVDNQDGAYLARLLLARGYRVSGVGGTRALARLGVADEVTRVDGPTGADEIYDLRPAGPARMADTAVLIGSLRGGRLFSAGPGPVADAATGLVAAAREGGVFAVTGRMFDRESRLSDGRSFVARIIAAAFSATEPAPADLASVADCGWAPEYVDAMWRMLQRVNPADFVLATGRPLSGIEVARHAFAYFGHDATRFGSDGGTGVVGDPGPARADLGWTATTWGRDLVRTLCEGLAEQKGVWA